MTTGQTIEAKITVDAGQAIAQIAKFDQETKAAEKALRDADAATKAFEKSQRDAVAAVTAIDERIARYHKDLAVLSDAVVKGTGNSAAYVEQMRRIEAELDAMEGKSRRVAAATDDVAKVMPAAAGATGMAANKMLILGQFVDDAQYGLRGVVNNMPQVAQAFGGGVGLAGAVGIAAVAVSQLYDGWKAYSAIQQEVASNMGAWRDALQGVDTVLREGVNKRTTDLTQALKDAQKELRNFGKTSREITEDEVKLSVAMTERQLAALERNLPALQERAKPKGRSNLSALQILGIQDVFTEDEKADFQAQNKILADATARRENLTKQLVEQKKAVEELAKVNKELAAKEAAAEAAKAEPGFKFGEVDGKHSAKALQERIKRGIAAMQAEEEARAKETEANMRDLIATEEKFAEQERKRFEDAEKEKTKIAKEQAKERAEAEKKAAKEKADAIKAIEQKQADFVGGIQQAAVSQLLSTTQGYIDAKIKGEKDAEQKAVASFLSATGQQLVASGTRAIFEGAIISANPLTPGAGLPMIGMGTAAIAAGLTMGGVGTAMTPPPADAKGGGGAARDRGAAPRSSRGGGGDGGPLVINVSYGVGGPLPEDTAREIARVMRTGNRRRGTA